MDVKQKKEFQREMKTIIIPALEKMIESEKKHIEDLKLLLLLSLSQNHMQRRL